MRYRTLIHCNIDHNRHLKSSHREYSRNFLMIICSKTIYVIYLNLPENIPQIKSSHGETIPSYSPKFGPIQSPSIWKALEVTLGAVPRGFTFAENAMEMFIHLTSIVDSQLPTMNHRLVLKSELLLKVADCLLQQNPKLKNWQRNLFVPVRSRQLHFFWLNKCYGIHFDITCFETLLRKLPRSLVVFISRDGQWMSHDMVIICVCWGYNMI